MYFAWADQKDKVCFIVHTIQGCSMENKALLSVKLANLLLFLFHNTFQKVTIALLHTSITLDS